MGSLKPGATYIYERSGGIIYAREFGKNDRHVVGYEPGKEYDITLKQEDKLWHDIRRAAIDNPAIDKALEQAKILYLLSKNDE